MTINTSDAAWIEVQAWAKDQIEQARDRLEERTFYPGSDFELRGRIAALRELLNLPAGKKSPAVPEAPTY